MTLPAPLQELFRYIYILHYEAYSLVHLSKAKIFVFCFSFVDQHKEEYIKVLEEAVAIQSVSSLPEKRNETIRMVNWTAEKLKKLGATLELCDIGLEV